MTDIDETTADRAGLGVARVLTDLDRAATPGELALLTESAAAAHTTDPGALARDLDVLVTAATPLHGLFALRDAGVLDLVLPELAALDLDQSGRRIHKDNLAHSMQVAAQAPPRRRVRWAALLHDVGKAPTRRIEGSTVTFRNHEIVGARMTLDLFDRLGYDRSVGEQVAHLVFTSGRTHGDSATWTDAAVRRFVRDVAGPGAVAASMEAVQRTSRDDAPDRDGTSLNWADVDAAMLADALDLSRADCTSRRPGRRAEVLAQVDAVEARIGAVRDGDLSRAVRPALDGNEIAALLGIAPGPVLGAAYRHLRDLAADGVVLSRDEAERVLTDWWEAQGTTL